MTQVTLSLDSTGESSSRLHMDENTLSSVGVAGVRSRPVAIDLETDGLVDLVDLDGGDIVPMRCQRISSDISTPLSEYAGNSEDGDDDSGEDVLEDDESEECVEDG
eukprot:1145524_1